METIPITRPYVGTEEQEAVQQVIASGWITQGPRVADFEQAVASFCGARHAVAVTSCTTALHLALEVSGVSEGDEVICPSLSFIATANAIRHVGGVPVFADVNPQTYNLCPHAARERITERTRAILLVHQIGLPADINAFRELADEYNLVLLEDAACAIGSTYRDQAVGGHGNLTCFSFHPRKVLSTGEGGMLVTDDDELAQRLRRMRHHGMTISDVARHQADRIVIESYEGCGYNYRMTDLQGAMGVEQMAKLPWIVERRRELARQYDSCLRRHKWLRPPVESPESRSNYQSYAVRLTDDAPLSQAEFMSQLLQAGISSRRGIMLAHREAAYRETASDAILPHSVRCSERSVLIPLFPQMTEVEQQRVMDAMWKL